MTKNPKDFAKFFDTQSFLEVENIETSNKVEVPSDDVLRAVDYFLYALAILASLVLLSWFLFN